MDRQVHPVSKLQKGDRRRLCETHGLACWKLAAPSASQATEARQREIVIAGVLEVRTGKFPEARAAASGSQATERREHKMLMGRGPSISQDAWQHHPIPKAPKLQPAAPYGSPACQNTRSDAGTGYSGSHRLVISGDARQHHALTRAPKLQEGKQEEIMMGDEDSQVLSPGCPAALSTRPPKVQQRRQ